VGHGPGRGRLGARGLWRSRRTDGGHAVKQGEVLLMRASLSTEPLDSVVTPVGPPARDIRSKDGAVGVAESRPRPGPEWGDMALRTGLSGAVRYDAGMSAIRGSSFVASLLVAVSLVAGEASARVQGPAQTSAPALAESGGVGPRVPRRVQYHSRRDPAWRLDGDPRHERILVGRRRRDVCARANRLQVLAAWPGSAAGPREVLTPPRPEYDDMALRAGRCRGSVRRGRLPRSGPGRGRLSATPTAPSFSGGVACRRADGGHDGVKRLR
jgi:hypothetical protein